MYSVWSNEAPNNRPTLGHLIFLCVFHFVLAKVVGIDFYCVVKHLSVPIPIHICIALGWRSDFFQSTTFFIDSIPTKYLYGFHWSILAKKLFFFVSVAKARPHTHVWQPNSKGRIHFCWGGIRSVFDFFHIFITIKIRLQMIERRTTNVCACACACKTSCGTLYSQSLIEEVTIIAVIIGFVNRQFHSTACITHHQLSNESFILKWMCRQ